MPRKKLPKQKITLFYPNKITRANLTVDVTNEYRGKIVELNFYLFFNILAQPYLSTNPTPNDWLQIHTDTLQTLFREEYTEVLQRLADTEYIEINHYFSASKHHCKSYKIHPSRIDLSAPFLFIEEEYDKHFSRKLETLKTKDFSQPNRPNKDSSELEITQYNHYNELVNDGYRTCQYQSTNLFSVPSGEALVYMDNKYQKQNKPYPAEHYFTNFNNTTDKPFGVDRFGNRLHTVITRLPKVLRKCLRYKSAPETETIEIDIVNSQPFFLSAVSSDLIKRYVPEAYEAIPLFEKYEKDTNFIEFKRICSEGRIYEYLQAAYEAEYGNICDGDETAKRDCTKSFTYTVMFCDYEMRDNLTIEEIQSDKAIRKQRFYLIFKKCFPAVYKLFKEVKAIEWKFTINKAGERKQYANTCLLAQRLESAVMFNQIVMACISAGYTEITTIHDCLVVRKDEYKIIKEVVQKAFNEINLNPKFK